VGLGHRRLAIIDLVTGGQPMGSDDGTVRLAYNTRNGFQFVDRQRRCHIIEGRAADRLLFDLLASEYQPL
jgi:asparagine synthetase B (glutamine-hydrolysing)